MTKLQNRGNHAIRVEEGELAQERRPGPDGEGFTEYQANEGQTHVSSILTPSYS